MLKEDGVNIIVQRERKLRRRT